MRRCVVLVLVSLCAAVACSALVGVSGAAASEGCANEARRVEQGSQFLPECRAYELVSPPGTYTLDDEAPGHHEGGFTKGAKASVDGSGLAWFTYYTAGTYGTYELSRRGADGWLSEEPVPPQSPQAALPLSCEPSFLFSPSLSTAVLSDGWESPGPTHNAEQFCPHNEPALVQEPAGWLSEPEGFQNLFLRDDETGGYSLVNRTKEGVATANAYVEAASTASGEEFSHVVFEERARLTTEAPALSGFEANLYEYADGAVSLVSYLPNGNATVGELADGIGIKQGGETDEASGASAAQMTHAVSSDGERVVFTAEGKLFMRVGAMLAPGVCGEAGKGCTVQLDAVHGGSGTGGGGQFLWASADGTRVFFMDEASAGLTSTTQVGSGENLYEYRLSEGATSGTLTDLTPYARAEVMGVSGAGEDGSTLYFVANAVLPGTGAPSPGNNLYVSREGQLAYIAVAESNSGNKYDWINNAISPESLTAQASANGDYLVFETKNGLSMSEIWRYGVGEGLVCVSCAANGTAIAETDMFGPERSGHEAGPVYARRQVLNDGDVFFQTAADLATGEKSSVEEVYEYADGAAHLLSSGTSETGSFFVDASEGGEAGEGTDVFFMTNQSLLSRATGNGPKLYDARVGGGFASEEEVVKPPVCGSAEGCKAPSTSLPGESLAASVSASGAGNLVSVPVSSTPGNGSVKKAKACKKGFVKSKGRCVKRKVKKKVKKAKRPAKGRK